MSERQNIGSMNRLVVQPSLSMSMVSNTLLIIQNEGAATSAQYSRLFASTTIPGDEPSCRALLCIPNASRRRHHSCKPVLLLYYHNARPRSDAIVDLL